MTPDACCLWQAGGDRKGCGQGMRRDASGVIVHPHWHRFGAALEHTAQPTDGSMLRIEEEMRGNLWEDSDEWRMRGAHGPAWTAALVGKSVSHEAARERFATTSAPWIVQIV